MLSSFETSGLDALLKDFYTIVGIRISIFDDEFKLVTEYPKEMPEICAIIRQTEVGVEACKSCDKEACKRAKSMGKPHIYTCHAGITEAITPINLSGGVVGYAIFAHIMPEDNYNNSLKNISNLCKNYGTQEVIIAAARKIKPISHEKIMAALRILDVLASYLQISRLATWRNDDISKQLDIYIQNNLANNIDSNSLCRQFFISRTKLYQIAKKAFGMSIMKYITHKRMEKAKELLEIEDKTITSIAKAVGIDDYNYFCKMFKKNVGTAPKTYRQNKVNAFTKSKR